MPIYGMLALSGENIEEIFNKVTQTIVYRD
jgi:hypothetical protein